MLKKLKLLFFLFLFLFLPNHVLAKDDLNLYFFWGQGCPHCAAEEEFLDQLKTEYQNLSIFDFEIYRHPQNIKLLQNISQSLDLSVDGVPFVIIGDQQFVGFSQDFTPNQIRARLDYCQTNGCPDQTGQIIADLNQAQPSSLQADPKLIPNQISLPFFGTIDPSSFSLPVLSIILGVLDGFNPCAMWTLLFLISLLLGMKDRKRMWILGTIFLFTSAFVYFLFMVAWLNLILFLGFIFWVRLAIGAIALLGGGYNLKEFFTNKTASCKVTSNKKRQKVFTRLKKITQLKNFWLALGGIILLAFAVNLVELVCSAGLPAIFTQILALSHLATWQYYGYIALYILFFLIDDLFVFFTAMVTLKMTGITTKYSRASKLIGGLLMLAVGILLIFKPELLSFG